MVERRTMESLSPIDIRYPPSSTRMQFTLTELDTDKQPRRVHSLRKLAYILRLPMRLALLYVYFAGCYDDRRGHMYLIKYHEWNDEGYWVTHERNPPNLESFRMIWLRYPKWRENEWLFAQDGDHLLNRGRIYIDYNNDSSNESYDESDTEDDEYDDEEEGESEIDPDEYDRIMNGY